MSIYSGLRLPEMGTPGYVCPPGVGTMGKRKKEAYEKAWAELKTLKLTQPLTGITLCARGLS